MKPMIVLTVKRDGGTQDVLGFYEPSALGQAIKDAAAFLMSSLESRSAIVRIELYNPHGKAPVETALKRGAA